RRSTRQPRHPRARRDPLCDRLAASGRRPRPRGRRPRASRGPPATLRIAARVSAEPLEIAAHALGPLTDELVFLGGASIQLWVSDPAAPATRATDDVDVISAVTRRVDYYKLGERLRE